MALKDDARDWIVKEQIIEDPATGLTFQFEVSPDGYPIFRIFGDLPFGNREIMFDSTGAEAGSGTALTGQCKPAWLTKVD